MMICTAQGAGAGAFSKFQDSIGGVWAVKVLGKRLGGISDRTCSCIANTKNMHGVCSAALCQLFSNLYHCSDYLAGRLRYQAAPHTL